MFSIASFVQHGKTITLIKKIYWPKEIIINGENLATNIIIKIMGTF